MTTHRKRAYVLVATLPVEEVLAHQEALEKHAVDHSIERIEGDPRFAWVFVAAGEVGDAREAFASV